jgi:oligoribonuclease (3'-5' exoribonuclease)
MSEEEKLKKLLEAMVVVTDNSYKIIGHMKKLDENSIIELSEKEKSTIDEWIQSYYSISAYITKLDVGDSSIH